MSSPILVHGMGHDLVPADWPALTIDEVATVLEHYALARPSRLVWRSPRPLSAAGLVDLVDGMRVFVKRHHISVRTPAGLSEEHRFTAHLRQRGAPVVEVFAGDGVTALPLGEWTYEVHSAAAGDDLYRDAISWSPFQCVEHAHAAGRALAHLHLAARGFDAPHRRPQPLVAGFRIFDQPDPLAALEKFAQQRPALADELARRPWRDDVVRVHLPFYERLRSSIADLEPLWTHGDWHASNLLWMPERAEVASVIDFGLADRAYAAQDIATAIERNTIEWLDLQAPGAVHTELVDALLDGYQSVRSLSAAECAALPEMLALTHVDYALSEVDYFNGITRSKPSTQLAYEYFVEHTAWFGGPDGEALLTHIRRHLDH